MKTHFSSMSDRISMECDLKELTGRDKVSLFKSLLDELGISDRLHQEKQDKAFEIINEQFTKFWPV